MEKNVSDHHRCVFGQGSSHLILEVIGIQTPDPGSRPGSPWRRSVLCAGSVLCDVLSSSHACGPLGSAAAVSACADQQFGTNFHRIREAQTLGNSLNVGLRSGYLSVRTAGGASDRRRLKLRRINELKPFTAI